VNAAEISAYNTGIAAVLDIARAVEARMRSMPWKPGREGAADALDELVVAGAALMLQDPRSPPAPLLAELSPPPKPPCPMGDALTAPKAAGDDSNFGLTDAEITEPSRAVLLDWLAGRTPMLASHWSRCAAALLATDAARNAPLLAVTEAAHG